MASIVNYDDGLKRIEFSLSPNGPRKIVRLGRVNSKVAEAWRAKIESIISDKLANRPHDPEVSKWLGGLDEGMLSRLRAAGLADGVGLAQVTLAEFMDRFFAKLAGKPATHTSYGNVRRNLEGCFGSSRLIRDISNEDADKWRKWLVSSEKLETPTISRRVIAARTMWRKAIRWKLATENPFSGVTAGKQTNDSRKRFVKASVIEKIIANAPDTEWKVIIALARFGGLRCPSEHYKLKWSDVDWEQGTMLVTSPKTEHNTGGEERTVPLFPELRHHLLKLFNEAEPGTHYIIEKHRLGCGNLRTEFKRIIKKAGEKLWPKLFHNLRASRETELMREYDLATVCKWIGNSPAVAAEHYATSMDLDDDFKRAAGKIQLPKQAQQNAQQSAVSSDGLELTSDSPENTEASENNELVNCGQSPTNPVEIEEWAIQDLNIFKNPLKNNQARLQAVQNPVQFCLGILRSCHLN